MDFYVDEYGDPAPINTYRVKSFYSSTACYGNLITQPNADECQDYESNVSGSFARGVFKSNYDRLNVNVLHICEQRKLASSVSSSPWISQLTTKIWFNGFVTWPQQHFAQFNSENTASRAVSASRKNRNKLALISLVV